MESELVGHAGNVRPTSD